ncbi:SLATT domain-containing protein [Corallococcus sp. AB011P]|uniref:SLATT domain-containing protein n=1 Tax=Corallococcus sp. AB011P TaxID=2316735 RepID=UPI000EA09136|nr:SLATT domain-containing protein [Corallococcus sp. AB011P]RKG55388.1 SLATT domain-containing protein [Corallococcus sp. AB011P]
MDKDRLLRSIAETGYNVGYGAKKHFATYDIVEKIPGWISFVSTCFGVLGLVHEKLSDKTLAATLVILGFVGLYIYLYDPKKMEYERVGIELTKIYNELRDLYRSVQSSSATQFTAEAERLRAIEDAYYSKGITKQILFSDWYAHYKFFWQHQIDWINEQKNFRLFRDKIPLTFTAFIITAVVVVAAYLLLRLAD